MDILLDMDGVIADFINGALAVHRSTLTVDQWPAGEWDVAKVLKMTDSKFWEPINQYLFWRELQPYPWFRELIGVVESFDPNWRIATSPSSCGQCLAGKYDWLREHLDSQFHNGYFCCSSKSQLANPQTVLIDDSDKNVENFRAAGGVAILFPQPWNSLHSFRGDKVERVKTRLEDLRSIPEPVATRL